MMMSKRICWRVNTTNRMKPPLRKSRNNNQFQHKIKHSIFLPFPLYSRRVLFCLRIILVIYIVSILMIMNRTLITKNSIILHLTWRGRYVVCMRIKFWRISTVSIICQKVQIRKKMWLLSCGVRKFIKRVFSPLVCWKWEINICVVCAQMVTAK